MNDPIHVLIVDDDDAFRQRARESLESTEGIMVVGESKDAQRVIHLIHETCPDVVLLDLGAPRASNLQRVTQIRASFPQVKIIVLNDEGQEQQVLDAFREGALGHLIRKKVSATRIVQSIRVVNAGQAVLSPDVAGSILDKVIQRQRK